MTQKEIISLENVSFSYSHKPFLENINLKIFEKEFIGISGPNGGGKTTLIKLILGLLKPKSGKITLFGEKPKKGRQKIGYLSQYENVDLDFPATAREIVLLGRIDKTLIKFFSEEDKAITDKFLKEMGIWELRDRKLNELSGGEKQRVFIAKALATEPQALILDEPLSNVDVGARDELFKLLKELNKKIAIIVVDHNLEILSKYSKQIVCVNKCVEKSTKAHEIITEKGKAKVMW